MDKATNGTVLRVSSTVITIVVIAVGVIYGYATLNRDVEGNCKDIAVMQPIVDSNHDSIIEITTDLGHLSRKVDENSATQKQILILQQEILLEVKK